MPQKTDAGKLKRENEILRAEINALRSSVRPNSNNTFSSSISKTGQVSKELKSDLRNDTLVLDFKYLRSDLTRTMILTSLATIAVIALSIFEPKTPFIHQLISSINI
ncbi:MAG: hypothetical protein NT141_04145 [candidate division WWE3 bacterium]|nr:hypothetical protein [candidate division WWE3 bacterium]